MTSQDHVIYAVRPSQSSLLAAIVFCPFATSLLVALIF
jgi:hypothetical protein